MNRVSLDDEVEAVKRFFLSLPADPQGSVVELDGVVLMRVGRISPIWDDGQWTDAKEERRRTLADKQIDSNLTPAEAFELHALQQAMLTYRNKVAPSPTTPVG